MPAVNEVTPTTLRRLAALRTDGEQILSAYLELDPSEFATAPARASEITSLIDEARHRVQEREHPHEELMGLRADVERLERFLREEEGYASGAHALAVFACEPLELFETLRAPASLERKVVIGRVPHLQPLVQLGNERRYCVALVDHRLARILRGSISTLSEVLSFGDQVHGQHKAGGWSQAHYQRSAAHDVEDHVRHFVSVLEEEFRRQPFDRLLIAATAEFWTTVADKLPQELRARLGPRLSIEVPDATVEDVNRAADPVMVQEQREHVESVLERLQDALAGDGRAVSGMSPTFEALVERRVEVFLYELGLQRPGAECPHCGWLSETDTICPVDGEEMAADENIIDVAIARAIEQDAEVIAVDVVDQHRDFRRLGPIAALLRY